MSTIPSGRSWPVPLNPDSPSYVIRNFIGRIDELTIWNVALQDREIADIYNTSNP
jgi:hypothetical protein